VAAARNRPKVEAKNVPVDTSPGKNFVRIRNRAVTVGKGGGYIVKMSNCQEEQWFGRTAFNFSSGEQGRNMKEKEGPSPRPGGEWGHGKQPGGGRRWFS